jgi:hypothetical protein
MSYTYVDLATQDAQIALDRVRHEIILGHHGSAAEFCGPDSKFHCFVAKELVFSVPRQGDLGKGSSEWTYRGHKFVATKVEEDVALLGLRLDVVRIDSSTQTPALRFWYDLNRGLVAIQGLGGTSNHLFLLRESCGFGSRSGCN